MNSFYISLPGVSSWWNSLMCKAFYTLDSICKRAITASIPGTYEFTSVVSLESAVIQRNATTKEMVNNYFSKEGGKVNDRS